MLLLNSFTPVLATTIYKAKSKSELSDEIFTYDLTVPSNAGEMEVEIHATEQNEAYVKRVAQILKEDAPKLIEYFGYVPWNKVHFVIDGFVTDRISKSANGGATVSPRPYIILYTAPPLGMQHLVTQGDWIKTLVLHELIHILHIDQTAGFMKIFRYLFGSDGKLGGVVPSWFAEGIATWGEGEFTNGGRLSSDLYHFEFHNRILNKGFCATSDCLDNSGKPPYQGTRYLFGSHFMKWLEDKKAGTVSCIVKKNSDNVPFFLHWAFRDCVKQDFQVLFDRFHAELKEKLLVDQKDYRKKQVFKNFKHFNISEDKFLLFEDGFEVVNDNVFVNQLDDKRNNSLKVLNLKTRKKTAYHLEDGLLEIVSPATIDRKQDKLILKTRREYYSQNPTLWKDFSIKKKQLGKDIEWGDAKYVFRLKDRTIGLLYKNNSWEVWERSAKNKEMIFDLPVLGSLYNPEVVEDGENAFITYRYHDYKAKPGHEYLRVDLNSGKEEVLFQDETSLQVIGSCGNRRILSTSKGRYSLNIQNGYVSNLTPDMNEIAHLKGNKKYTVLLLNKDPERIYYKKINCEKWIDDHVGVELEGEASSEPTLDKDYLEDKSSYPEFDHYIPQRWSVGYSTGDSTGGWTFSTSVSDPGNVHNLEGNYKIYTGNDEKGGSVFYLNSNDYFDFFSSYFKQFLTSNTKTVPDYVEQTSAGIVKTYYSGWLSYTPSLSYTQGKTIDIVSNRKFKKYGFGLTFETEGIHYKNLLRHAELNLGISRTEVVKRKKYLSYRAKPRLNFRINYGFTISVQSSYEKLDKDDLASGVAYAGGANDNMSGSYHEFYGIQSNDAFGNEVITGKLEGRLLINERYGGPRYFPLFIKKLHVMGGAGYLKTDFVYIDADKRFLRDKSLASVYGGISGDIDLFYLASMRVDILLAQLISNDIITKQSQMLFLVNAGF